MYMFFCLLLISTTYANICDQTIYSNHEKSLDLIKIDQKHERDKKIFSNQLKDISSQILELEKQKGDLVLICEKTQMILAQLDKIKIEVDHLYSERTHLLQKDINQSIAQCATDPGLEYYLQDLNNVIKYEFHSYRAKAKALQSKYRGLIKTAKASATELNKKSCP